METQQQSTSTNLGTREPIHEFIETSKWQMEKFFPSWKNSGKNWWKKTYLIPPSPIIKFPGPIDEGASGYDDGLVSKQKPIIQGDCAESKVHKFLAESNRHCFVLQNFTTSKWRGIFGDAGYDTSNETLREIFAGPDIEIDFLVLHPYLGIIAFEVKSIGSFKANRYNDAKKQLKTKIAFLKRVQNFFLGNPSEVQEMIPSTKVISFPSVTMKDGIEDFFNLGENHLKHPNKWWSCLAETGADSKNLFESSRLYQQLIHLFVGLYLTEDLSFGENVMKLFKQIGHQDYLPSCSRLSTQFETKVRPSAFEEPFFLTPEQNCVLSCQAERQLIYGEYGTGKTLLLMQKALNEMKEGNEIVIYIPGKLKPRYEQFRKQYRHLAKCHIFTHEEFIQGNHKFSEFCETALFADEFDIDKTFLEVDAPEDFSYSISDNFFDSLKSRSAKAVIALSNCSIEDDHERPYREERFPYQRPAPYLWVWGSRDFEMLELKSIMRNTCSIIDYWRQLFGSLHNRFDGHKLGFSGFQPLDGVYHSVNGHNVVGPGVEEVISTPNDYIEQLVKVLQELKRQSENMHENQVRPWPNKVCVLSYHHELIANVKEELSKKGFPIGSISEQLHDDTGSILAVDVAENSVSLEWPVVIALMNVNEKMMEEEFALGHKVVLSRAISKLFHVVIFSEEDRPSKKSWPGMGNYMKKKKERKRKEKKARLENLSRITKENPQLHEDEWNRQRASSFILSQEINNLTASKDL